MGGPAIGSKTGSCSDVPTPNFAIKFISKHHRRVVSDTRTKNVMERYGSTRKSMAGLVAERERKRSDVRHACLFLPRRPHGPFFEQGSRINDRMVIENALDVKKSPFSAYSRPKRQQAVEYQWKYCKKMQTKREKQKSSTPTGDPLQRVGSELKKRKPG